MSFPSKSFCCLAKSFCDRCNFWTSVSIVWSCSIHPLTSCRSFSVENKNYSEWLAFSILCNALIFAWRFRAFVSCIATDFFSSRALADILEIDLLIRSGDWTIRARDLAMAASTTLSSPLRASYYLGCERPVDFARWRHTLRFVSEFLSVLYCSTSWTTFIWASLVSNIVFFKAICSVSSCSQIGLSWTILALINDIKLHSWYNAEMNSR